MQHATIVDHTEFTLQLTIIILQGPTKYEVVDNQRGK